MDPVTVAIATAVAGKVSEGLVEGAKNLLPQLRKALRARFKDAPVAADALESAQDNPDDDAAVQKLARCIAESQDPEVRALLEQLRPHFGGADSSVTNTVTGNVHGNVIQARDVHGGIQL